MTEVISNGELRECGVIIGRQGSRPMSIYVRGMARLLPVVSQLKLRGLSVALTEDAGWRSTGYLGNHGASRTIPSGPFGLVARVATGSGLLHVSGRQHYQVDEGDWIYVPPGRKITFEGTVITGLNLSVVYAHLQQG